MKIDEIKQIVKLMSGSNLTEFEIEEDGLKLKICRGDKNKSEFSQIPMQVMAAPQAAAPTSPAPAAFPSNNAVAEEDANAIYIKSPMVGTFYKSPSPENPAFVDKGDSVDSETIVCIIEAMKVMNEIKSDVSGKVVEVLVENGAAIEFGQPLFKLK